MKGKQRLRAKKETFDILLRLRDFLSQRSIEAYLTGGFVRDALLGEEGYDIDIVAAASAMKLASEVAGALEGKYVSLDEANEIARVVLRRERPLHLDFSTMRGSIEEDLSQRDFTIDAIAVDLNDIEKPSPPFIDPFGGEQDLRRGVVRAISEEAFVRDPARLLRGLRLAAEFGFSIDNETKKQIEGHHQLITTVAAERVRDELCRLLAAPRAAQSLRLLDELGLLLDIFPELSATKGAEQPKEHFWDVFEHSVETVSAIEFVLRIGSLAYYNEGILALVPWSSELERHFEEKVSSGHSRKTLLKLVALLHDVAKPATKSIDEKGRMRFLGHAKEGATVAEGIMERLRFSAREKEMVRKMVLHHLRPGQLSGEGLPTRRAIYRYFRDTGNVAIDTIFLNLADHLATRGPELDFEEWRQHAEKLAYVLEERFREESIVAPPKLIDGHDVIDSFDLIPGPKIGELLEAVREAQAAGDITTREEALAFVQKQLSPEGAPKAKQS
ncbi:MAG: HD domain-containing protein [Dehalococcoidia bacterium]|jgi:poly(A) polymerase|nr:HD domain-containing protein [Chloroflexota bacterium]MCK4242835.1 HD domain-containing protein [Dehalococcoidia bacterium]